MTINDLKKVKYLEKYKEIIQEELVEAKPIDVMSINALTRICNKKINELKSI